jgi:hypothetical protein
MTEVAGDMAKVYVEGDHEALDEITAVLRSAGRSTIDIDIEFVVGSREVTELPATPGNWATFADLAPDLSYSDWREEVLSLVDVEEPVALRAAPTLCETVTDLRLAG